MIDGAEREAEGRDAPPVEALLAHIAREMGAAEGGQLVHVAVQEPVAPSYRDPAPPPHPLLTEALRQQGIERLYSHQAETLERARAGEHLVVVTPTSSGKTLCYNLPVLEAILADRSARALYLYPINALINDQLKALFHLNLALGREAVGVARYTGSLRSDQRRAIRERQPHICLTNPEMLHLSFLLWHTQWEDFWRHLRYIVVDEVHTYRGVFGANMAHLFRRALRIAAHYGSRPQFICCSATIANPKELAESLTGLSFGVIDRDGAGRGRRHFVLWNPPLLAQDGSNLRRSYAEESVDLLLHCVRARYNTIVFARARALTERMLRISHTQSQERGEQHLLERIASYRAGYLTDEREEVESRLKTGDLLGVITTNALEMGIDIGGLDAAIISGYPGTMMSTWQQAGRAGRRGRDALVMLVASQNPLDQYYIAHPTEFLARPHELAVVDLENPYIRLRHLLCAARELPLTAAEVQALPAERRAMVDELREHGLLTPTPLEDGTEGLAHPASRREIHMSVSLRSAGHETYRIVDERRREIGTIEPPNLYREAHPGAIYQHAGEDYRVLGIDRRSKEVRVRAEEAPHYTRAQSVQLLRVEKVYAQRALGLGEVAYNLALGEVEVEEAIRGYQELRLGSDEMVRRVNLEHPLVVRLHTTAAWISLPHGLEALVNARFPPDDPEAGDTGEAAAFAQGLHALEHLLTGVLPLLVMCDRRDIDGHNQPSHPDLGAPAVFLYDAYEGGLGLAEVAYQRGTELLALAHDTVTSCACRQGCPSCIQSGTCRQRNEMLHKGAAEMLLAAVTGRRSLGVSCVDQPRKVEPVRERELSQRRALDKLLQRTRQQGIAERLQRTRQQGIAERLQRPAAAEPRPTPRFAEGDWVEQSPYGRGQVLAARIEGGRELVKVRFVRRGTVREVDATVGNLRKVGD